MKKRTLIIFALLSGMFLLHCERDWVNPYDSECPPEIWSPQDLQAEAAKPGVQLTWEQREKHFDGFLLERSTDSSNWQVLTAQLLASTAREFKDTIHKPGQSFFYRIVAVADKNKSNYANAALFFYPSEKPTVITSEVTDVDSIMATFNGVLKDEGGADVTEKGFYFGLEQNVETTGAKLKSSDSEDDFSAVVDTLTPGKIYYVKAYALNENGYGLGQIRSFQTAAALSKVKFDSVVVISAVEVELFGNVTDDGGAANGVTERGFYIDNGRKIPGLNSPVKVQSGSGLNNFNKTYNGLTPGTVYTAIAYSVNVAGISFSDTISFKTKAVLPEVITEGYEEVTLNSALLKGNIKNSGGAVPNRYGFVWAQHPNPTMNDNVLISTQGLSEKGEGSFDETLNGLEPGKTYYYRAFAENEVGTKLGETNLFTTLSGLANVVTYFPDRIFSTSAVLKGQVIDEKGSPIIDSGFYLSADSAEIFTTTPFSVKNGLDTFKIEMNDLQPGTEYYVVAFAETEVGVSSGEIIKFRTDCKDCIFGEMTGPGGKVYKTIRLGNKIWMAENLAYLPAVSPGSEESKQAPLYYVPYYNGNDVLEAKRSEGYKKYGVWYNWPAADKLKEVLSDGWRVPSDQDWKDLEAFLGMTEQERNGEKLRGTDQGIKLKYCWDWDESPFRGTNEVCFGVLAAGAKATFEVTGQPLPIGEGMGAGFWTTTTKEATSGTFAFWRGLFSYVPNIYRIDSELSFGFSVRLVKDAE